MRVRSLTWYLFSFLLNFRPATWLPHVFESLGLIAFWIHSFEIKSIVRSQLSCFTFKDLLWRSCVADCKCINFYNLILQRVRVCVCVCNNFYIRVCVCVFVGVFHFKDVFVCVCVCRQGATRVSADIHVCDWDRRTAKKTFPDPDWSITNSKSVSDLEHWSMISLISRSRVSSQYIWMKFVSFSRSFSCSKCEFSCGFHAWISLMHHTPLTAYENPLLEYFLEKDILAT